ncbi:unnamed protein product, partial [Prorocentrum cordatum]
MDAQSCSEAARNDHVGIVNRKAVLIDPAKFEERASNLFQQDADRRHEAIDQARQSARSGSGSAKEVLKVQLWNPISKRLVLSGVKASEGTVLGPNERLEKLVEHWQPVFQGKHVDLGAASAYLRGVIHQRNVGYNTLELDVESRIVSADPTRGIISEMGKNSCIFKCAGCDESLVHYPQCERLAWAIARASGAGVPSSPLARLGITDTSTRCPSRRRRAPAAMERPVASEPAASTALAMSTNSQQLRPAPRAGNSSALLPAGLGISPAATKSKAAHESAILSAVKQQMDALEDRLCSQIVRAQQQGDRVRDAAFSRVESKVATTEAAQPRVDRRLAELNGNYK